MVPLLGVIDWQSLAAYALLAAALFYLARRVWRIVRSGTRDGAGHGGGCGGCPRNPAAAKPQNLVQLDDAPRRGDV